MFLNFSIFPANSQIKFGVGWTIFSIDCLGSGSGKREADKTFNKAVMLRKGEIALRKDFVCPGEEIKDPFVREFAGLKDEYSEIDLEEALILHLEARERSSWR